MMKKFTQQFLTYAGSLIVVLLLTQNIIYAQLPAFPGAEGFGKFATGGRTGTVYRVTNLNDAGAGSLRDAVSAPNRIVVFDVAGVIRINARMVVSSNIYLAGQTAPGEGITVYGNGWSFSNADNTICRYMKIRMGIVGESGKDACGIADGHDMIFDHCSVSWGRDETFSINATNAQNITIQNTIMSQGLLTHSAGGLIQTNGGVTLYRNLYVDNGTRNNKIKGVNQYVNNIVYNWSAGAYIMGGDSQGESFANAAGNCFIQGPVDGVRPFSVGNSLYHLYENDNLHDNDRDGTFNPYTIPQSEFGGGPDFQVSPYTYPVLPTVAANSLLSNSLPSVGASLPYRDFADYYVVNEVKSLGAKGTLIANESVLPFGTPSAWTLWGGTVRTDTDNDGMPDAWETANGLNPAANDAMIISGNGYTNIENFINGIGAAYSQPYLRAPLAMKADSATQTSIYFSWLDYTEQEQGFIVERKVDGIFVQVGATGINENYFTLSGMAPEEKDTFRVKAFNASGSSAYSNELIAKTKPVTVPVIDPATFVPDLVYTAATNETWDYTSANWLAGSTPSLFTDSSKLLFPEAGVGGHTISLPAQVGPKDIVVNSTGDYSFSGAGFIAGSGSMNKTGAGKLSLLTNNSYTGATVLRRGTLEINSLQNGGLPSSIGASANYNFNWVWKGGTMNYTGANASTDRSAVIDSTTAFSISNAGSAVTVLGVLSGTGGLTKSGPGRLVLRSANPYEGETIIKGGVLEVQPISSATEEGDIINNGAGIGSSNILRLQGGTYRTTNGSITLFENYPMHIYVEDGTVNGFEPYRNANLNCDVSGNGTLNYAITYSRELIQGDWSQFTGTLVANGVGTLTGAERSTLMIDNGVGLPNSRILTAGNTKIASYQNLQTLALGGLSGPAGTSLSCGAKTSGGVLTWAVGGAGTDETFNGIINNEPYGSTSNSAGITSIIKEGDGLWRLTGNNIYSGTTSITGGSLIVNGSHSGGGKFFVNQGTLAGTGTAASDVEVSDTLQPGDNSIGTLSISRKLILLPTAVTDISINKTTATWDKINVGDSLTYAGTIKIAFTGTPLAGDKFKIFTTTHPVSGTITQIIPASPGAGLEWHFIPETGELIVSAPGFVNPPDSLDLTATTTDIPVISSTVQVSWRDNSDNEDYFILERSLDNVSFTDIFHPLANATAYTDNGLLPSTKYYYRLKAHGASQESPYCSVDSVTTPNVPTAPLPAFEPVPADGAQGVGPVNGQVTLKWKGSDNTETYEVYFGTASGNLTKVADVAYSTTPQYIAGGLLNNSNYYWRIDAKNFKGTTAGPEWDFATANIPATVAGDYRTIGSGNWGSGTVATGIWETFDGTNWVATATGPVSVTPPAAVQVNTITIRSGHTVTLNATTAVNNLVIENAAVIKSGTADGLAGTAAVRTLRVSKNVFNYGTFGSSGTSTERISFEGYRDADTVRLLGSSRYYINNFNVNSIAQTLAVDIDADLNINGFLRAFYSTSTTLPWTVASQNDDNITLTIKPGRTVTLGSSSYLHVTNTPTTNTIAEFGNYTYNIDGLLDMKATGTSCIVAHTTLSNATSININGTWLTGNAMRLVSTATTVPAGTMAVNIGNTGLVDAGARYTASVTTTNLVVTNATTGQTIFFNISGNGALRNRVATSDVTYAIGTAGTYSPVKLSNTATAGMVSVGVKDVFSHPVALPTLVVNREFSIEPVVAGSVNLGINLGWIVPQQASAFNPAAPVVIGHYGTSAWDETAAVVTGAGTVANPYYAKATGFTSFSPFAVANTTGFTGTVVPLRLISFGVIPNGKVADVKWTTSNELNLARFEIERSEDAVEFRPIAEQAAMNISGTHAYAFTDLYPSAKSISWYRLKMIDADGRYSYSDLAMLRKNSKDMFAVFPNPAADIVTVSYATPATAASLRLTTMDGRLVKEIKLAAGSRQVKIDLRNLAGGSYILSLKDDNRSSIILLKQ